MKNNERPQPEAAKVALDKLSDPNFDWSNDCDGKLSYDEWVVKTAQLVKTKSVISDTINLIDDMCRAYWGDKMRAGWDNHLEENFKNEMRNGMRDVLEVVEAALQTPASDRWMPIGTCPKEHGVDYRLWDETDKEERVTWYGRGEWCHEGNYTHWQYLTTPILKQSTAKDTPHDTK